MARAFNDSLYSLHRKVVEIEAIVSFAASTGVPTLEQWNPGTNGQPGFYSAATTNTLYSFTSTSAANVSATTGSITLSTASWTVNQYQGASVTDSTNTSWTIISNTATVLTVYGGSSPTPTSGVMTITAAPLGSISVGFQGIKSITQNATGTSFALAGDYTVTFQDNYSRLLGVLVTQMGAFVEATPTLPAGPDVAVLDSNFPPLNGLIPQLNAPSATGLGFFQDSFQFNIPHSTGQVRQVPLTPLMTNYEFAAAFNTAVVDLLSITIPGLGTYYPTLTASMAAATLVSNINTAIGSGTTTLLVASVVSTTHVQITTTAGATAVPFSIGGNPLTLATLGLTAGIAPLVSGVPTVTTANGGSFVINNPFGGTFLSSGSWPAYPAAATAEGLVYATVTSGAIVLTKTTTDFDIGGAAATLAKLGFVTGEQTSSATSSNGPVYSFTTQIGSAVELLFSLDGAAAIPVGQSCIMTFLLDASTVL